jgi:hypothetical protein
MAAASLFFIENISIMIFAFIESRGILQEAAI